MSTDTALNPRILLAELAIYKLNNAFQARLPIRYTLSRNEISDTLKAMNSAVQTLKYSYLNNKDLAEHEKTLEIRDDANKLFNCVKKGYRSQKQNITIHEATIYWGCRLLARLPERLLEDMVERKIEAGLDSRIVGIRNIAPIEGTDLHVTRVHDGQEDHTVVTNLTSIKPGMKLAACFLPPAEVGRTVSEAMFLGDEEYPESSYGTPVIDASFSEVRALLKAEFDKMKKSRA